MLLLSKKKIPVRHECGDFSNWIHTSQQVVKTNFHSALQSWLFQKWRPRKTLMLNSAECPLQGAKCLECPFNKCELRAASNSQEMLKRSSTQSYRYVRSFFLMAFFFFLSLLFNKVCVVPLSSLFFRGEDSNGNVLVCSTFPSCFCSHWHMLECRSRAALSSPQIHSKENAELQWQPEQGWEVLSSPREDLVFRGVRAEVKGTLSTAKGTCDKHWASPCTGRGYWFPAASTHQCQREALLNTSGTHPSCLHHGKQHGKDALHENPDIQAHPVWEQVPIVT